MNEVINISEFKSLSISQKIDFLDGNFIDSIQLFDDKSLNVALRSIALDSNENSFVRKNVLKLFTDLVFIGKLKNRQALSLLIDDWSPSKDVFLELQRLKDLLLYYEESNEESDDIESIFKAGTENSEAEIVGECFFNLGSISFLKALKSSNEKEFIFSIENSNSYFQKSIEVIENRVDSNFYKKIILILKELKSKNWNSATILIKELGNYLFQKESFSFKFYFDSLQYGFYKILSSLQKICIQQPKNWIDYRLELDKVFLNYTEITNSEIKNRQNEKAFLGRLGGYVKGQILEPYFTINLSSEITKIDVLIREKSEVKAEYEFLQYLKAVIENTDKKKVEFESLESDFKKLFPKQNPQLIAKVISDIKEPTDYIRAFELLSRRDNDNLISCILYACSKLQGDIKYWGKKVNENERNRFIATILESAGYTIKDQPQWSTSAEGNDSGEIDIFITESNGTPKSIIEGLVLDSLKKDYLILHLDKLFRYDTTGLENNYIITYSLAKSFDNLWKKYQGFISSHAYTYKFSDFKELFDLNFADIRIGVAQHSRNKKMVKLYHIIINLVER